MTVEVAPHATLTLLMPLVSALALMYSTNSLIRLMPSSRACLLVTITQQESEATSAFKSSKLHLLRNLDARQ